MPLGTGRRTSEQPPVMHRGPKQEHKSFPAPSSVSSLRGGSWAWALSWGVPVSRNRRGTQLCSL